MRKSKTPPPPQPPTAIDARKGRFWRMAAEAAFERFKPRLSAIADEEVLGPSVDVQAAAVAALGLVQQLSDKGVRKRFDSLSKSGEFDSACIDDLATAAWAAWYARDRLIAAGEGAEAQLPASLVQGAVDVRARMMRVVEYYLGSDPRWGPEVAAIRTGTGHQDLAGDLLSLAELYRRHMHLLSHDAVLYNADDEGNARQTASTMLRMLSFGSTPEYTQWFDYQSRAWTVMLRLHEQVRRAARFLYYFDEGDSRFPPLATIARDGQAPPPSRRLR